MVNHVKCRHLIIPLPHHKEYRIKKLREFAEIVDVGYVHHLQTQTLIIFDSSLFFCSLLSLSLAYTLDRTARIADYIFQTNQQVHPPGTCIGL